MSDIKIKIYEPAHIVKNTTVSKVIIPAKLSNLTVISGRAPSSILLKNGLVQILDKNDNPSEKIFIQGGIADINDDVCNISTEKSVSFNQINEKEAEAKSEDENLGADERAFYKMISEEIKAFK